jgi:hypothetical protein
MKTKLFFFLLACIVMGMVMPTFAVSPDKNKGDKTKTDNLSPSPLPPSPWYLTINVTDPKDSCTAYTNCTLGFFIEPVSPNCAAISATPTYTVPILWGQADYTVPIPDTITCVQVSIIVTGFCGGYPINTNTCCTCKTGYGNPCRLKICP